MQPARLHVQRAGLDLPRERLRQTAAALEHHDVVPARGLGRMNDLERNIARLDQAELLEDHRFALGFPADVNALGAVRREGAAQVDDAILRIAAADIREHVAQRVCAERLEAFRHQRASGVATALDVRRLHRRLAAVVAQGHGRAVLAGDRAVVSLAVLRLDAPRHEARIELAIRIEDGNEQLRRTMRAHA